MQGERAVRPAPDIGVAVQCGKAVPHILVVRLQRQNAEDGLARDDIPFVAAEVEADLHLPVEGLGIVGREAGGRAKRFEGGVAADHASREVGPACREERFRARRRLQQQRRPPALRLSTPVAEILSSTRSISALARASPPTRRLVRGAVPPPLRPPPPPPPRGVGLTSTLGSEPPRKRRSARLRRQSWLFRYTRPVATPPRCARCAMPSLAPAHASTRSKATRNVTSHFAGIGSGSGKTNTGWSGQYQANATATARIAPDAPRIRETGIHRVSRNEKAAPPIPERR